MTHDHWAALDDAAVFLDDEFPSTAEYLREAIAGVRAEFDRVRAEERAACVRELEERAAKFRRGEILLPVSRAAVVTACARLLKGEPWNERIK